MRICHIIVGTNVGGAEQALRRLLQAEGAANQDRLVISLTTVGPVGREIRALGLQVEALGASGPLSAILAFLRLRKLLRDFAPDVVQTWMYHADIFGGLAARSLGLNCVFWGIRNTQVPSRTFFQRVLSFAGARLSNWVPRAIICVAHSSLEPYAKAGYRRDRMKVIGNGLDFVPYDRIVADHMIASPIPIAQHLRRIVSVGRFHTLKGQDILLEAGAELVAHEPATFVLVGRGCDNGNASFWNVVQKTGMRDHIIALGERTDVPEIMLGCSVFCLPSRTEGFPNVLLEAMALGMFCVASRAGDSARILGDTGILVSAGDPGALAAGLRTAMLMDPDERRRMGQMARGRARSLFSIDKIVSRYHDLYKAVLEGSD